MKINFTTQSFHHLEMNINYYLIICNLCVFEKFHFLFTNLLNSNSEFSQKMETKQEGGKGNS